MTGPSSPPGLIDANLPSELLPLIFSWEHAPLPALLLDGSGSVCFGNRAARWAAAGSPDVSHWAASFAGEGSPLLETWRETPADWTVREILVEDDPGAGSRRIVATPIDAAGKAYLLTMLVPFDGAGSAAQGLVDALREDAMQAVIDAVSEAVLLFDAEGRCVLSNGLAQEATGYPQEELATVTLEDLGLVPDRDGFRSLLTEARDKGVSSVRGVLISARGERIPVRGQARALIGAGGRVVGLLSFVPPRVTSGRLAAVRQSGGYARPGTGRVSGTFARPATSGAAATRTPSGPTRAAGLRDAGSGDSGAAASDAGKEAAAPKRAAGSAPDRPAGDSRATPSGTSAPADAPAAPPDAAPGRTLMGRPAQDLAAERKATPSEGDSAFEEPRTTVELEDSDLEEARAAPPPPPPAAVEKRAPSVPAEIVVRIAASPSQVTSVGKGLGALLGYPENEVTAWSAEQWFRRVHEPALADQLAQMWSGLVGQRFEPGALPDQTMEYPLVRRDGRIVRCITVWRAVQAEDGTFQGLELLIRPQDK